MRFPRPLRLWWVKMTRLRTYSWLIAGLLLLAGCGGAVAMTSTATTASSAPDPTALPLGDGHIATSPRVGYVDSCMARFGGIGGAQANGPWIDASAGTWNYETKLHVNGAISWPQGRYGVRVSGSRRIITSNDLPAGHVTGVFPIARDDPASAYDRNPNRIAAQSFTFSLPLNPRAAGAPSCTGGGPIGVLADGVVLYNALDGEGRDAGAHEVLDVCAGHPDMSSTYHHHDVPPCLLSRARNGRATLVGYALDGYGIYVVKDAAGRLPGDAALDACHGTTSAVRWNGRVQRVYHYVATLEYPYTVGCYHGTPTSSGRAGGGGPPAGPPPPP